MTPQGWLLVGLLLLGAELLVPGGLVLLFFGLAALTVGLVDLFGMGMGAWAEVLLFAALSVVSLVLLRGPLQRRIERRRTWPEGSEIDTLVGETALLGERLAPGEVGSAELRGTVWSVRSASAGSLAAGQRCRVTGVKGLTLTIVGESEGENPSAAGNEGSKGDGA